MKKMPLVAAAATSILAMGQAQAFAPIVHDANSTRAHAYHLNDHAANLEAKVRSSLRHGYNPVHLRQEARALRNQATNLAWKSNRLAKAYYSGHHY